MHLTYLKSEGHTREASPAKAGEADAPLSVGAWEILRALALGIRIREFADGWQAVGPWQEPSSSGIDSVAMTQLIDAGFVERQTLGIGCYAAVTDAGQKALSEKSDREFQGALEWLRSNASLFSG